MDKIAEGGFFNMKIGRVSKTISAITFLIVFTIFISLYSAFDNYTKTVYTPKIDTEQPTKYEKTIIAVADIDFQPYSFINKKGVYSGHDIELIYQIGHKMGVNIEIHLMQWSQAKEAVLNGKADVLLGMHYDPSKYPEFDISVPIFTEQFLAFGKSNKFSVFNAKLAAIKGSGAYDSFLVPYRLTDSAQFYNTYPEVFKSVENGENDFAIAMYAVGKRITADLGFTGIKPVGTSLADVFSCLCVAKGNPLLTPIDDAILELIKEGTVEKNRKKWLGNYVEVINVSDFIQTNWDMFLSVFLLLSVLIIFLFAYNLVTQKKAREASEINQQCFKALADNSNKAIYEWDIKTNAFVMITDIKKIFEGNAIEINTPDDVFFKNIVYPDDIEKFMSMFTLTRSGKNFNNIKMSIKDKTGYFRWCNFSGISVRNSQGKPFRAIAFMEDINEQVEKEHTLTVKAEKDLLTGLYNKVITEMLITNALQHRTQSSKTDSLFIIDVDNFKNINDSLGHLFGDKVLFELANNLKSLFRTNDIIGRIGGDEFFVFLRNVPDLVWLQNKAKEICGVFHHTYTEKNISCTVSASVGIALCPNHGADFETLYKNADIALYTTKQNGKNNYTVFDGRETTHYESNRTKIDTQQIT